MRTHQWNLIVVVFVTLAAGAFGEDAQREITWSNSICVPRGGRFLVTDALIFGKAAEILVDIGSTRSSIDSEIAKQLGPDRGETEILTSSRTVRARTYRAPLFRLGSESYLPHREVFLRDFSLESRFLGTRIEGSLGTDAFLSRVVQINFDEGVLRTIDQIPESAREALGEQRPILLDASGQCKTQLSIGRRSEDVILAFGSNSNCLRGETFDALVESNTMNPGADKTILSLGGAKVARSGLARRVQLGSYIHQDVVFDRDAFDAVGLRYLSRFVVTLDFPRRVVYLRPSKKYEATDPRGYSGLTASRSGSVWLVTRVVTGGPADKAGLRSGDEIIQVNGIDAESLDYFDMGSHFVAQPNSKIDLIVLRQRNRCEISFLSADRFAK